MLQFYFVLSSPKKENSFIPNRNIPPVDRFGMQNDENKGTGYYIYDWDTEKGRHIQKWIAKDISC